MDDILIDIIVLLMAVIIYAYPVMWLWNIVIPAYPITVVQSMCIVALSRILFH